MKYLLTFCLLAVLSSFSLAQTIDMDKKIDPRFLGTWTGSEKDKQIKGLTKYWLQNRNDDGTYLILFTNIDNKGKVRSSAEKGKWWVENGLFFESTVDSSTESPTVYKFEILDDERIKFKVKSTDLPIADQNYEFIDTKIDD